jgi:hypothetical protein
VKQYQFVEVERNQIPAPIPYILNEDQIPSNQDILVFLPHSDDGRFLGGMLYLLNKQKRNNVKLIIMSPGHHGVDGNETKEQKSNKRMQEAYCWAEMLGYRTDQVIDFRADETYEKRQIVDIDQNKLDWLICSERPTMVFVPHICDTAQPINYNTRKMVFNSLISFIVKKPNSKFIVEYPTNHVPILPPSDKNFIVSFSDNGIAQIKHNANLAHESQQLTGFNTVGKFVEAVEAVSEADLLYQLNKKRRYARYISDVIVDAGKSRGEHFGVTILNQTVVNEMVIIKENRLEFPLNKKKLAIWNRKAKK